MALCLLGLNQQNVSLSNAKLHDLAFSNTKYLMFLFQLYHGQSWQLPSTTCAWL
jgi:hypothetical protein